MTSKSPSKPTKAQHILLFGASGASGLAFIKYHLSLPDTPSKPYLTLYIRPSGRSKLLAVLPSSSPSSPYIRIVEGQITDKSALNNALSPPNSARFPPVTAVISLLGAYMTLYHFLTRTTPTPISDAFKSVVLPTIRESVNGQRIRILVLSTPTAYPVQGEYEKMSWAWWLWGLMPKIVVPQGNAEMKGLADAVMNVKGDHGFDVTVFRVPMLTNDVDEKRGVLAGYLGHEGFTETKTLARSTLARWLLKELEERVWIGKAPMLADA